MSPSPEEYNVLPLSKVTSPVKSPAATIEPSDNASNPPTLSVKPPPLENAHCQVPVCDSWAM